MRSLSVELLLWQLGGALLAQSRLVFLALLLLSCCSRHDVCVAIDACLMGVMVRCRVVAVWAQYEVFILLALWFSATDYLHLSLPSLTPLILARTSPHRLCRQGGSSTPATVTVGRHHRPLRTEHFWLRASPVPKNRSNWLFRQSSPLPHQPEDSSM